MAQTDERASDDDETEEVLDATISDPNVDAPGLTGPSSKPYNPDEFRDNARKRITYWLLALLTVLFVGAFVSLFVIEGQPQFEQLKALLEILLGPLVALVSAATGFYFGAQSAKH
jgi:hypothetical protein